MISSRRRAFARNTTFVGKVCEEVNAWAEKETKGLIKEIFPSGSIDSSARLILANALYFKGEWDEKFDASKTEEYDFHLLNGSIIKAPFMTSKSEQFLSAYDGFKVLRLPYKQGGDKKRRFSMYFYLPDAEDGLPALVEKLGSKPGFLERHLPTREKELDWLLIPKFNISFGFEASETLKGLGLMLPFSGGLKGMTDSPAGRNLCVANIFHKAFIEVNEEGTEAAAVTVFGCRIRERSVTYKHSFVADHPFLFVIREDYSGVVQFIGSVVNPTLS